MDRELQAMNRIHRAIEAATDGLPPATERRVLGWVTDRMLERTDELGQDELTRDPKPS